MKIIKSVFSVYFILILSLFFITSCTHDDPVVLPSEKSYETDTQLMLNICNKFTEETDIQKLHAAVVATQTMRVVACVDYNNECHQYNDFLNSVIEITKGGTIRESDRDLLRTQLNEMKKSIETGKIKLHAEWMKKNN